MSTTNIEVMPHTLFFTVGPSNCGKTFYCKEKLLPQLAALLPLPNRERVQTIYISSDDIRRELLGQDFDKYHPAMLAVSKPAFDLLFQRVKSAMMFPVNAEFIIVDTKGTSEAFREKLYEMATNYRYSVVPILFNYSDFDEYAKHGAMNRRTMIDIKKTRAALVGIKTNLPVKGLLQIKSNDFEKAPLVSCGKHELLRKCILPNDKEILIISDIHGCYDEFLALLGENKIKVENHRITENPNGKHLVIAGDYIDSGPQSMDMVDFCYENPEITVVIGNHEHHLYRELTLGLEHIEEPYYDSFHKLDELHKERFIAVFERSLPFALNDRVVITHAPCSANMVGKLDAGSLSGQRYCPHETDADASLYSEFEKRHVFDDDIGSMLHIFGHIPTTTPGKIIDNRMLIDGGCVGCCRLVSVSLAQDGKTYVKSVPSQQKKFSEGRIPPKKYAKPASRKEIDLSELTYADRERIKEMAEAKVNFLSGTMSPCDKLGDALESIEAGVEFFQKTGITDVVMEPKYMGSRCNLYLFATNEESYAVSRNGHRISLNLSSVFDAMRERLKEYFDWSEVRFLLLDGELMPWSALGEGLIQEFQAVANNVEQENRFLKESGFTEAFMELKNNCEESGFRTDRNILPKAKMAEKYGNTVYETYKTVDDFQGYIPLGERERLNGLYRKQMELYGTAGPIDYKPFAILKVVYHSGEETVYYREKETEWTNETMFNLLNGDGCYRYDLEKEEDVAACIEQFSRYTTENHYEGVVLKPNRLDVWKVPPYMKVRNPDYLTIIYGYDYLTGEKHRRLCARKSIKGKLGASLREWRNGLSLLAVKYDDICSESEDLQKLYASFIFEEKQEESLDPRL